MIISTLAFGIKLNFWESAGIFLLYAGTIIGVVIAIIAVILYVKALHQKKIPPKRLLAVLFVLATMFVIGPFAWNRYYDLQDKRNTIAAQRYEQSVLDSLTFHPLKPTVTPQILTDARLNVSMIDKNNLSLSPSGDVALEFTYQKSRTPGDIFNIIATVNIYEINKPNKALTDGTCPDDQRSYKTEYNKEKLTCRIIGSTASGEPILLADDQRYDFRRQLDYYVDIGDARAIISYGFYTDTLNDKQAFTDKDAIELIGGLKAVNTSDISLSPL